jgi:hypothetical protein
MVNFYRNIDDSLISALDLTAKNYLKKKIENLSPPKKYVFLCPYCNFLVIVVTPKTTNTPRFCSMCGESDPFEKIQLSIEKVQALYELSQKCTSGIEIKKDRRNERILLEQCIVILATGIELFFKDFYVIGMDLMYVKNEHSLVSKFSKDIKNEFLNTGKIKERFRSDLKINIDSILDSQELKKINTLLIKRHAIVHNNGLIDKKFQSESGQTGIEYKHGFAIPISSEEINEYLTIVRETSEKFDNEFNRSYLPEFLKRINYKLNCYADKERITGGKQKNQ